MKKLAHGLMALTLLLVSSVTLFACNKGSDKLTIENYNAIVVKEGETQGWTLAQVKDRLGEPTGDTKVLTGGAGELVWKNKDETKTITVTFTDSRVSAKSQTGLEAASAE